MDKLEQLLYTTKDPLTGMPAMTTLYYAVCDTDGEKFDNAARLVRLFMEAAKEQQ